MRPRPPTNTVSGVAGAQKKLAKAELAVAVTSVEKSEAAAEEPAIELTAKPSDRESEARP